MRITLTSLVVLILCAPADAGWITVVNKTDKTVYVQEVPEGILPGILSRRRKQVRLQPGEQYREFQAKPGERSVDVFDAAKPAEPVHKAILKWGPSDVTFTLSDDKDQWSFAVPKPKPKGGDVVTASGEKK